MYEKIGVSMLCSPLFCTILKSLYFISQDSFDRLYRTSDRSGVKPKIFNAQGRLNSNYYHYVLEITRRVSFLQLL